MYVSILMLFPCRIVVLLSLSAVWLSSTLVTVEIWCTVSRTQHLLDQGRTYTIPQSSDLPNLQLRPDLNVGEHPISFLELFDEVVVVLEKIDMLLASFLNPNISASPR